MYTYPPPEQDGPYWQVQEAKAMFSAVVRSADRTPQVITVHGKESAVVLSIDAYRKLTVPKESLVHFMEQSPWAETELELPGRSVEAMREIDL